MKARTILLGCVLTGAAVAQTVLPAPAVFSEPTHLDSTAQLAQLMQSPQMVVPLEKLDLIKIEVFGADALSVRSRIAVDGTVYIPLAGSISLVGLTVEQAEKAVADLIRDKSLVLTPAVTIDVLESPGRVITINGEVMRPGVYPAIGDAQLTGVGATPSSGVRTLGQLLGLAGGLKDTASGILVLNRPSLGTPVDIPIGTDPNHQPYNTLPIFAGDEILVSHVGQAYVVGAVGKQGPIPLKNYSPTTVSQAIASSNGIGFEAAENDARLLRTQGNQRVMYKVQVRKILQGKAPDIALQNDDILYVPTVAGKAALKAGGANLIVSIVGTYLYTR